MESGEATKKGPSRRLLVRTRLGASEGCTRRRSRACLRRPHPASAIAGWPTAAPEKKKKKRSPTSCSLLYLPATFSFVLVMDLLPLSCASSMEGSRGLWCLDAWIRQRAVLLLAWRGTVGCAWDMGGHGSPASRSSGFLVRRWLALLVLG